MRSGSCRTETQTGLGGVRDDGSTNQMSPLRKDATCRIGRIGLVALLCLVPLAVPCHALQPVKPSGAPRDLEHLIRLRAGAVVSIDARNTDELPANDPLRIGWRRFSTRYGGGWRTYVDERSGLPTLSSGRGIPWIAGRGNDLPSYREITFEKLEALARQFLTDHRALLGDWQADLLFDPSASAHPLDSLWKLVFSQSVDGIPVEGARFEFHLSHGNLVAFGTTSWARVRTSSRPKIDARQAQAILRDDLASAGAPPSYLDVAKWSEPHLLFVPLDPRRMDATGWDGERGTGLDHALIWRTGFEGSDGQAHWVGEIDAHSGRVIAFYDSTHYERVSGGVFPRSASGDCADDGCETGGFPMPFVDYSVDGTSVRYTGSMGLYACDPFGAIIETRLAGSYVLIDDLCGTVSETTACDAVLDLGLKPETENCASALSSPGNTAAARTAFYQINRAAEIGRTYLPNNTWLQGPVSVRTNVDSTCNASWNGQINMYRAGNGCGNTGENQGVLVHEWGHGLDQNDGGGYDNPSEAYADVVAIFRARDSCIGPGFKPGVNCDGYGDTCLECTGIRDHDWQKRQAGVPATPAGFTQSKCGSGSGPCGRQVHCEAYPLAESIYDLAYRDLPASGLDPDTSWQVAERLWYSSRDGSGGDAFNCSLPSSDSCSVGSWYHGMRLVDDDDGDLSNGTPHAAAIFAAFSRHNLACGLSIDPENQSNSSCPALQPPTLTSEVLTNTVELSWSTIPEAAKYKVFRSDIGCNRQQVVIGETSAPTTTYTDTSLPNGFSVYYRVQARGDNDACESPVSNCLESTPQPYAGKVRFQAATYGCSHAVQLEVTDANVGSSTVVVEVASDTEPIPESVVLTQTAPGEPTFAGEILSTTDPPVSGDGMISTAHADNIHAEYVDADDGAGGKDLLRVHDTTADCVAPLISNLSERDVTDVQARITWNTDEVSDTVLVWGTTVPPDTTDTGDPRTTSHEVLLTGLQECTLYYYEVRSTDPAGNLALSDNGGRYFSFETLGDFGNGLQPCHTGQVTIDDDTVDCSTKVTFHVIDVDLNADPNTIESTTLLITSSTESEPEVVIATETGADTSKFAASINTVSGPPIQDGLLQTRDGDLLTVTYKDQDDGSGESAIAFDTSTLDCAGPQVTNLRVDTITNARLTIRFDTEEPSDTVIEWGDTPSLGRVAADNMDVTSHSMVLNDSDTCSRIYFRIRTKDVFGNESVVADNGGPFVATTNDIPGLYWRDSFENGNQGWTLNGEWEIGPPQGRGGSSGRPDPITAYNNSGILGHDLSGQGTFPGDYEPNSNESARSPVQSALTWTNTKLILYRRLNAHTDDDASLWIWTSSGLPLFRNDNGSVFESDFTYSSYDVSAKVDGAAEVSLEFRQSADSSAHYSGWNVDDVIFKDGSLADYAACRTCDDEPSFAGAEAANDNDACGADGVTISWPRSVSWGTGEAGTYSVYRSGLSNFTASPENRIATGLTGLSYNDTTAPVNAVSYYIVQAENDEQCGSGPNNGGLVDGNQVRVSVAETTEQGAPGTIDTLAASLLGSAHLRLTWAAPQNAASYNIYRSFDPRPEFFAQIGDETATIYDDIGVGADRETYFYLVRAVNACGIETP